MIDAKDTVMMPEQTRKKRKELFPHGHKDCYECEQFVREAQAEISFKLGYEERDKWLNPDELDRLEIAHKAGRREVVEWIEKNHLLYDPDYDDKERWQAQKKVWFNEKV